MKLKFYLILIVAAATFQESNAQNWATRETIQSGFVKALKSNNRQAALDGLAKVVNPVILPKLKQKLVEELGKIDTSYAYKDWNSIVDTRLADGIVCHSFVLKYADKPYRVDILYYNYNNRVDTWMIQDISIDSEVFEGLKNAGKADKLKQNNRVITTESLF